MISMQMSIHSLQMYTVGPAISFLTSFWLLPQKLQRNVSSPLLITAWSPHQDVTWTLLLIATLNGIANGTKVAIYLMAASNRSKGITRAPENHKQVGRCAQALRPPRRNLVGLNRQTPDRL